MTQSVAQAWLVLRISGNGIDLGVVSAASMLPVLIGSPPAGALVERLDKRRVLLATQTSFLVLATVLGLLTSTGLVQVWMVLAVALCFGVVNAVDGPTRQVYVLDLVGAGRAANAVSMNEVVLNTSRVIGPALGGALLATVGVAVCFYVNAATFLLPIAVLAAGPTRVRVAGGPAVPSPAAAAATARRARVGRERGSFVEGLRYAWRTPVIRYGVLMAGASGMLFNMGVALPLMATRSFHAGGGGYGGMMACFGGGALFGAVLAGSGPACPPPRRVRWLAAATGAAVLGAAAMPDMPAELLALAVVGLLSIWFVALANSLVQLRAAPELRSRVMGVWVMALPGLAVVTGPLTGWVAGEIGGAAGARDAFGLAGLSLLLAAGAGWRAYGARREAPGGWAA